MEAVKEDHLQGNLTDRRRWPKEDILNLETKL